MRIPRHHQDQGLGMTNLNLHYLFLVSWRVWVFCSSKMAKKIEDFLRRRVFLSLLPFCDVYENKCNKQKKSWIDRQVFFWWFKRQKSLLIFDIYDQHGKLSSSIIWFRPRSVMGYLDFEEEDRASVRCVQLAKNALKTGPVWVQEICRWVLSKLSFRKKGSSFKVALRLPIPHFPIPYIFGTPRQANISHN